MLEVDVEMFNDVDPIWSFELLNGVNLGPSCGTMMSVNVRYFCYEIGSHEDTKGLWKRFL